MTPLFELNPRTQKHEILSPKTRDLDTSHGKDFMILVCTVLIQLTSVTDRQTDGRTDGLKPRPWLRRVKHSAIARRNRCV